MQTYQDGIALVSDRAGHDCAGAGGVQALSRMPASAVVREEGRAGIRADGLGSELIDSGIGRNIIDELSESTLGPEVLPSTRLRRCCAAQDIARTSASLATSAASAATGQALVIDGCQST